jgi:hypothetical protein
MHTWLEGIVSYPSFLPTNVFQIDLSTSFAFSISEYTGSDPRYILRSRVVGLSTYNVEIFTGYRSCIQVAFVGYTVANSHSPMYGSFYPMNFFNNLHKLLCY